MVTSALYRHGIGHLAVMEREMREWMEKHEYDSIQQMRGSMSQTIVKTRRRSSAPSTCGPFRNRRR